MQHSINKTKQANKVLGISAEHFILCWKWCKWYEKIKMYKSDRLFTYYSDRKYIVQLQSPRNKECPVSFHASYCNQLDAECTLLSELCQVRGGIHATWWSTDLLKVERSLIACNVPRQCLITEPKFLMTLLKVLFRSHSCCWPQTVVMTSTTRD